MRTAGIRAGLSPSTSAQRSPSAQLGLIAVSSTTTTDALLDELQELLATTPGRATALPLGVIVEDIQALLLHRRDKGWQRARNAIGTDWAATMNCLGPALRSALGPAIDSADTTIRRLVTQAPSMRERHAAEPTLAALLAALCTEGAIRAAWHDVIDAVGSEAMPWHLVWDRRAVLADALRAAGHDAMGVTKLIVQVLGDQAHAVAEANVKLGRREWPADFVKLIHTNAGLPAEARLALATDLLCSWVQSGRCVVWLGFIDARVDTFHVEAGAVTFLDAEWAVPNAQEGGQTFPHRDELSSAMQLPDADKLHNVVLARVDLGVRPVTGAASAAVDIAETIVQAAVSSRSVGTWSPFGWRMTFVDGNQVGSEHFVPEREANAWVVPYKLDEVAERLADLGARLGRAVAIAQLPIELREALKSSTDAQTANPTGRILHHYRVLELLAALAGIEDAEQLAGSIANHWPVSVWRGNCMDVVTQGHHAWMRSRQELPESVRQTVRNGSGMSFTVDFAAAAQDPQQMVKHLQGDRVRRDGQELLESLTDPGKALTQLAMLRRSRNVLTARLSRVRNALVHGNPMHASVVASLDEFAEFLARSALREALEAHMSGQDLNASLQREKARTRTFERGLRDGRSPLELWTSREEQ